MQTCHFAIINNNLSIKRDPWGVCDTQSNSFPNISTLYSPDAYEKYEIGVNCALFSRFHSSLKSKAVHRESKKDVFEKATLTSLKTKWIQEPVVWATCRSRIGWEGRLIP